MAPIITKGKIQEPVCILLYGVPGVGKTKFASEAPNPIFMGERGNSQMDVARFNEPKTFKEVNDNIQYLMTAFEKYETFVLDTLSWLEPLIWNEVLSEQAKPVSDISKIGYNKGYESAVMKAVQFTKTLSDLRDQKKMNIVLLGHSKVKTFQDPITPQGYDRYLPAMRDDFAVVFEKFVDAILFANFQVYTKEGDKRGYGEGVRVIYTEERPSFVAKNRYGLKFEIPMRIGEGWKAFFDMVVKGEPNSPEVLLAQIEGYKANIKDQAILDKITVKLKEYGRDTVKLTALRDQLISLVGGLG